MTEQSAKLNIGILIYPEVTQLDFTGPYEICIKYPNTDVHLIWKDLQPIKVGGGCMRVIPSITYHDILLNKNLDILVIPGGSGVSDLLNDLETVQFVKEVCTHSSIRYITSVCTGALLLGASGILIGKKATTHWQYLDMLKLFHATPVKSRIVQDGNVITGGGVTAGIDFAIELASLLFDETTAMKIQLAIEYNPQPPFDISIIHSTNAEIGMTSLCDIATNEPSVKNSDFDGDKEHQYKKRKTQTVSNEIVSELDFETKASASYSHRMLMVSEASYKLSRS